MTKLEASQLIAILFGSFPSARLERTHVDAYVSGIIDLDAATALAAVNRLRMTSKFLPAIAEIREAATAQRIGPRKTGAEAYDELLEAVRRHGATPAVRMHEGRVQVQAPWPPLAADVALAMRQTWGTWSDCCHAPDAQEMADRARFIAAYDGLAERERADVVSGQALPAPARSAPKIVTPKQTNGAHQLTGVAGAPAAVGSGQASKGRDLGQAAAAPAAIIAPQRERQPAREPRKWSADELDAELDRIGGMP